MKYALISDVHSNLPALEAVLAGVDARGDVDAVCPTWSGRWTAYAAASPPTSLPTRFRAGGAPKPVEILWWRGP